MKLINIIVVATTTALLTLTGNFTDNSKTDSPLFEEPLFLKSNNEYIANLRSLSEEERATELIKFTGREIPEDINLADIFGQPGYVVEVDVETGEFLYDTYQPISEYIYSHPEDPLSHNLNKLQTRQAATPLGYSRLGCSIIDHACWYGYGTIGDFRFFGANQQTNGSFPNRLSFWSGTYYAQICWNDTKQVCAKSIAPGQIIKITKPVMGKTVHLR